MQVPDLFRSASPTEGSRCESAKPTTGDRDYKRSALAMCENIDWNVKRVLSCLERQGVTGETIVICFKTMDRMGCVEWRYAGKEGVDGRGGVRSPLMCAGGSSPGRRVVLSRKCVDLMPTLCDLLVFQ